MNLKKSALALLFLSLPPLRAQFSYIDTHDLKLIYGGQSQYFLAPYAAQCFHNALASYRVRFDYRPSEQTYLFMHDFRDIANASAGGVPHNTVILAIAPYNYVFETLPGNERVNAIINHELVHILTTDEAAGQDRFFRKLFLGKVTPTAENPISIPFATLTTPRIHAPIWFWEGIAVFMETWMTGGIGRAMSAWDEMVFRTKIKEGGRIYDRLGLESEVVKEDFQGMVNAYLYGTRFMSYLALKYGPETVIQWVARTDGTRAYFSKQFQKVYGMRLDQGWEEWIQWEKQFQQANLAAIRLYPTTPYRAISARALGSVSPARYDPSTRSIYLGVNYPGEVAHIAEINVDTGQSRKICDVKGAGLYFVTHLAFDPSSGTLFYTNDNSDWRDLRLVNVKTGESRNLMKDARIGDLAFNTVDKSLWGVRHFNGLSTIVRIPEPYQKWRPLYSYPYGQDIYNIDISPDGAHLVGALTDVTGRQKLVRLTLQELLQGRLASETLYDFEFSSPANFVYSSDGRFLYGSSYYSGVSNIYRYDLQTKDIQVMSNAESGFFRPVPLSEQDLLVFNYTDKGFVPGVIPNRPVANVNAITFLGQEIVDKRPVVKGWQAAAPSSVDFDSLVEKKGKYSPLRSLGLYSAYPMVEGYKDSPAIGMRFNLASPLASLNVTASASPDKGLPASERFHLNAQLQYKMWKLFGTYNRADFYDLFGPTKTSRKGYSAGMEYKKVLIFDRPGKYLDYTIQTAGYGGMDRLPDYQNIGATYDKLLSFKAKLNYRYLLASVGALENEKGFQWEIAGSSNVVNGKFYPRFYNNFDYGVQTPLPHSSIWLRSSVGYSVGKRDNPFANFYFGGFGNNWVDRLAEDRYREFYSFPGVELNEIGGRNYSKAMVEWVLPPVVFGRFGLPACYLNWIKPSLFTSGIVTNLDHAGARRSAANVGGQLDLRLITLSRQNLTVSVGYALAGERRREPSREFMISLKLH